MMDSWESASDGKTRIVSCEMRCDERRLTNDGIVVREVADLINVDVSAVPVVQLYLHVVAVGVRAGDGARVEEGHLAAPVGTDPPAWSQ